MQTKIKSVAIVGAGASGLIFSNVLKSKGFDVTLYECRKNVGGVWNYDSCEVSASAMYKNLRTNLPTRTMAIPFEPFNECLSNKSSFIGHKDVQQYLLAYAERHNLREMVKFEKVSSVTKVENDTRWCVNHTDTYDAVVIANGHYNKPFLPREFCCSKSSCKILHSLFYDTPDAFDNERVLVVGSGPSGSDIISELLLRNKCSSLAWSRRPKEEEIQKVSVMTDFTDTDATNNANITSFVNVKSLVPDSKRVIFADGEECEFDVIIVATGYLYSFPFLHTEAIEFDSSERYIRGLYLHMLSIKDPSLAFAVAVFKVAPFPMAYSQAQYLCSVWSGDISLPSCEEMRQSEAKEWEKRKSIFGSIEFLHCMGELQWKYMDDLLIASGNEKLDPLVQLLYKKTASLRTIMPFGSYRNVKYLIDEETQTFTVEGL